MGWKRRWIVVYMFVMVACSQLAAAHPGHGSHGGFDAGIAHPLSGIDHILAMVAVGLLAAQMGGRALWLLPVTFIGLMVSGGLLAFVGVALPRVEQGITASVVVLGILIAIAAKWPTPIAVGIVGLFAIFHGHAHVSEMQSEHAVAAYAGGFVLATTLLHAAGIAVGLSMKRLISAGWLQVAGAGIATCGFLLAFNVL